MTLTETSGTTLISPNNTHPGSTGRNGTATIATRRERLAELVHLLADVPFEQALVELKAVDTPGSGSDPLRDSDPLWLVAGALVGLAPKRL